MAAKKRSMSKASGRAVPAKSRPGASKKPPAASRHGKPAARKNAAASEKRLAAARAFVPLAHLERGFTGLNAEQADLAYEMSAFATSALMARIGASNLGFLLQDLDGGQTIDTAIQRFGVTFADFEAQLAKRVGAARR